MRYRGKPIKGVKNVTNKILTIWSPELFVLERISLATRMIHNIHKEIRTMKTIWKIAPSDWEENNESNRLTEGERTTPTPDHITTNLKK